MSSQLLKPQDISPQTLAPDDATANEVGAAFGDWQSAFYSAPGTPNSGPEQSASEINVRFDFSFGGATAIEILPELASRAGGTRADPSPAGYRDSAGDAQLDVITLVPANMLADPGSIDLAFSVKAAEDIRFSARAIGGGTPTLAASVTAG